MDNNIQESPTQPTALTSDEKLLALLSHFSMFLGGIILAIVLYFVQKDKSKFVAFHALQSIFFHLVFMVIMVIFVFFLIIMMFATGVFSSHNSHELNHSGGGFVFGMIIFYIGLIGSALLAIAYAIYMGVKAYNGDMKRYVLVGNWAYNKVYGK